VLGTCRYVKLSSFFYSLRIQAHYQDGSFLTQCLATFGESDGIAVWDAVNGYFDTLPLAASIDGAVFCVHGGIPQELCEPGASLDLIRQV
jgi:diadenosine tetraphosphatase ApaH/serine/threonine PP2A family protein phosphatase